MVDLTRAQESPAVSSMARPAVAWGRPKPGVFGLLLLSVTVVYIFLPMIAVFLYGLATTWTNHVTPDGYTLAHWRDSLADGRFRVVLGRSLGLAIGTALLDLLLVTPAVYWQRVRNPRIRPVIEILAAIPFSVPYAVIAFGLLPLSGTYAPSLQGTLWLLLPAHAAVAFSFAYWAIDSSMAASNVVGLSEAARTCGANVATTLTRVILPNIMPGLASGAVLAFGVSFNEVALVQILCGNRFETVPLYTLNLLKSTDADFNSLAVMTGITFAITLVLSVLVVSLNKGRAAAGGKTDAKGAPA